MVRVQEIIDAFLYAFQTSEKIPDDITYVGYMPDIDTEALKLPILHIEILDRNEIGRMNTDFVAYYKDDNGNDIGKVYQSVFETTLQMSVWTAQGSRHDPRKIGDRVRDEIYTYTKKGPGKTLTTSRGETLDEVWHVVLETANHTDDMGTSPVLRRWQQNVRVRASEQFIENVEKPHIKEIDIVTSSDIDVQDIN
jgi:hypothetical protein